MHPAIDPSTVESEVMAAPSSPVGSAYLYRLGEALRAHGGNVEGVDAALLADVLSVGMAKTWDTALHRAERNIPSFVPMWTIGNRRSLLPGDLEDGAEEPLRSLAEASANPFVESVLREVLWGRFKVHTDARLAVEAHVARAALMDVSESWPEVSDSLARATLLARSLDDKPRLKTAVGPAIEATGLAASQHPAVFVGLASELCFVALSDRRVVAEIGSHGTRWGVTALWAARVLRGRGDHHRAEDALTVAAALLAAAGQSVEARELRRERLRWMLDRATAATGLERASLVQLVLDQATQDGLAEEAAVARRRLRDAVNEASKAMKGISVPLTLPTQITGFLQEIAVRAPSAADAVRSLAAGPWLTAMPVEEMEKAAKQEAEQALFLHMIPSIQYRDGKISGRALSPEEKLAESVARNASLRLALSELAADVFLQRSFARFDAETLFRAVGSPDWMDARRLPWLARASERFNQQDFASSTAIVLTQYEGVLRDLARAAGYPALKYQDGKTKDETLNSLLSQPDIRSMLGEEQAWFVEFLLCRPEMGPNLRNELAHGNLEISRLQPGTVLLVWILLIRLAMYEKTPHHPACAVTAYETSTWPRPAA
ncbi:MAG: DUF4209 domain-containing protein [Myxococcales bacterium]|nr:DUF4209 domain-containing protein [Myxococcales bacterium]